MTTSRIIGCAFAIISILVSCAPSEETTTSLIIDPVALGLGEAEVTHIGQGILYKVEKADTIALDIDGDVILDLMSGWDHHYIHISRGSEVSLDTVAGSGGTISTGGVLSKENEYLIRFGELASKAGKDYGLRSIAGSKVDTFMMKLDEKHRDLNGLLSEIRDDADISVDYKKGMTTRLAAMRGQDILAYEGFYKYLNKVDAEVPDDFYEEADLTDIDDSDLLQFNSTRGLIESWVSRDIDYEEFGSSGAYFDAILTTTKEAYSDGPLAEYLQLNAILNQINFGEGIDGAAQVVDAFELIITNQYVKQKLALGIEPWADLRAGLDAPNFTANDREGNAVELSELKGKRVYIDVWATWCGPCIREIPSLKKLEKELHGENIEFVSVSIDEAKNKDKWLTFVKEKDLGGTQLMAEGAWKSDITTSYNIKGIPRFLLIDEGGKILSANAPRPSEENIKKTLLN